MHSSPAVVGRCVPRMDSKMGMDSDIADHLPAPGWYEDPWNACRPRWWDGTQWTENGRPMVDAAEEPTFSKSVLAAYRNVSIGRGSDGGASRPWWQMRRFVAPGGAVVGLAAVTALFMLVSSDGPPDRLANRDPGTVQVSVSLEPERSTTTESSPVSTSTTAPSTSTTSAPASSTSTTAQASTVPAPTTTAAVQKTTATAPKSTAPKAKRSITTSKVASTKVSTTKPAKAGSSSTTTTMAGSTKATPAPSTDSTPTTESAEKPATSASTATTVKTATTRAPAKATTTTAAQGAQTEEPAAP